MPPDDELPLLPVPSETGNSGSQEHPDPEQSRALARLVDQPASVNHIGAAIDAVPEIRGAVAMQLAAAGYRQMASDLQEVRAQLQRVQDERDQLRTACSAEHTRAEVLASQLHGLPRLRRIQSVALAAGGVISGVGLPALLGGENIVVGLLLTSAGGVLTWFGAAGLREEN